MKDDILKIIAEKHSGTAGDGTKIYSHVTDKDLNAIIAASVVAVVNTLKERMDNATDEWDTVTIVEQTLHELNDEFGTKKTKKNKIK